MLQIILIGAALSHMRPEPQSESGLPTDPLRCHRESWRCTSGVAAFWRWRSRPKTQTTASERPERPTGLSLFRLYYVSTHPAPIGNQREV